MIKEVIYSAGYGGAYPFRSLGTRVEGIESYTQMTEPNSLLIIWGGADINPALYNHAECKQTYAGGRRDATEWDMMHRAIDMDIPIIGVCRGAQMLCAAAGGYLFQHTTGHTGGSHVVKTINGLTFSTNSIHHQMMFVPEGVDHEALAWVQHRRSGCYIYNDNQVHPDPEKELEYVYFTSIRGFAIQWHPEGMGEDSPATKYIMETIHDRC